MIENDTDPEHIAGNIRNSVGEIMATMAMSELVFAGMEKRLNFSLSDEAVGLVRLSGDRNGMLGISTNQVLLRIIVSRIIGLTPEELEREDLIDGIAELANMIGGSFKTKARIPNMTLSPPVAILGKEYVAEWKTSKPTMVLTFQAEEGVLQVYASL